MIVPQALGVLGLDLGEPRDDQHLLEVHVREESLLERGPLVEGPVRIVGVHARGDAHRELLDPPMIVEEPLPESDAGSVRLQRVVDVHAGTISKAGAGLARRAAVRSRGLEMQSTPRRRKSCVQRLPAVPPRRAQSPRGMLVARVGLMQPDLSNEPIQVELTKCVDQLRALREEVRLQVHLAGMNTNRTIDDIGKELEAIASEVANAARPARAAFLERLRRVEDKLTDVARSLPGVL